MEILEATGNTQDSGKSRPDQSEMEVNGDARASGAQQSVNSHL